jgi:PAS domain S-box-containing protein
MVLACPIPMMVFENYREMQHYVRWGDADASALRALLPHVEPLKERISEEFYERVREHPGANAIFRDEAQVRRLQQTLQVWVVELLTGPHDEAYFERRCRIGAVHARVGLSQRYVFAAMSVLRQHLERITTEAFAGDPGMEAKIRLALARILDLELTIMLETYRTTLVARIERVDRLARDTMAQKLAAAELRYRDAIESAQALVMVLDADGGLLLWNRMAAAVTGYERDELLEGPPLERLMPEPEARERLYRVTPEAPDTFGATLLTRSGRERHVRWLVSVNLDPEHGQPVRYVFGVDLTDVREAERRARNAERLASVGTLAAGLAHEIRNPLNAASLHLTVLDRSLQRMPDAPPQTREATAVLRNEIKRLSSLVTEFLEFARPRPLRVVATDLTEICSSVLELIAPAAESEGVELVFERPSRGGVDPERLRQVLLNLLRNGIEAARGTSAPRVTTRLRRVGVWAEIDIEDNGPGIPDEAPIFDAFYTTKEQGTGLGLAIVHRIVHDHEGTVGLQSQPGETVFTLRLPGAQSLTPDEAR